MATRNNTPKVIDASDSVKTPETPFDEQYEKEIQNMADKTPTENTDDVDSIDDIPDNFNVPNGISTPTSYAANGSLASSDVGLSLDELDEKGVSDDSREELERRKLDNPTGDWYKVDRWDFEKKVYAGDCMPGDIDPSGRTVFTFKGQPKTRTVDSIEYTPSLYLSVSPDYRASLYDTNKPDSSYKLYLDAKDMYLDIKGEVLAAPRKWTKLCVMLENDDYTVRTSNYNKQTRIVEVKRTQVNARRRG